MTETPYGNILLDDDGGGPRHFLEGRAIHCGEQLQVQIGGHWVYVRYEMSLGYPNGLEQRSPGFASKVPKPTFHAAGGRIIPDNDAEFRWPKEGK